MYNIKAVSKMLDMPTVTIRSWETRYQAVIPERTDTGHRVYTEENVNDLKSLKKMVQDEGLKVSQAVKQLKAEKKQQGEVSVKNSEQRFGSQIEELYEAVTALDTVKCDFLFDLYFSQLHYKTVFISIIVPLLYKVDKGCEKGELHVVKEHMISNIVLQRFMNFFRIFETSPSLPRVIAICPEGEHHQLGLILFTLFLREKHYPVFYIGADTPLEGLGELINEKDVEIVAISISRRTDRAVVEYYIDTLQKHNPKLKFIVGGLGIKESFASNPRWDISPGDKDWLQTLTEIVK